MRIGIAMLVLASMLWGTTGTAQALVPLGLPPHWVGSLRLLTSCGFFWLYAALQGGRAQPPRAPTRLPWRWLLLAGACMAAYNLTFFAGVKGSSVAVGTAVALGSGPIFAGLLQIALWRRLPTRRWWCGTLIAVAGGCLMLLGGAAASRVAPAGLALCLGAGLSYAVYAMASKHIGTTTAAPVATARVFSLAALISLPFAFFASGWPVTDARGWGLVVYLGVVATGVAYLLFTHALERVALPTAVSMTLIEPLTAFCLAIAVVGERPPAAAFAGLALVLVGLAVVIHAELRRAA